MPRRKKSSHENQSRSSLSINQDKPQQRYAANARERARMRVLSRAFCRLKTTLPWVPADTKLSKLDTLRLAASYIAHLKGILRDETLGTSESSLHPAMSLTWPFGFNRPLGGSTGGGSQLGGSLQGSDLEDMDEEDEDNDDDDYDEESISSCTWEEVNPPTKECVHLDKSSTKRKASSREPRRSSQGGKARGKRNNNDVSQVHKKETPSLSSPSTQSLSKQTTNVVAPRPLSQAQQQHHHHLHQEHFQNESNNNNVLFHHHPHSQQHLIHEARDKSCISPSSAMMTVTNLENTMPPFLHSHNEVLVGIGGSLPQNNETFVDVNDAGFMSHPNQHQHQNHHLNHHQHEMHSHHHIAPSPNPFGFNSNDLIPIG